MAADRAFAKFRIAFAAIRQGLAIARGRYFAVMAADLQEPPELVEQFFDQLDTGAVDLLVGVRGARADPLHYQAQLGALLARIPVPDNARYPSGRGRRFCLQHCLSRRASDLRRTQQLS